MKKKIRRKQEQQTINLNQIINTKSYHAVTLNLYLNLYLDLKVKRETIPIMNCKDKGRK